MPTYTIFAGVNGAGKTSIYNSIYYEKNKDEKRINTDGDGRKSWIMEGH